ncbi:MAG: tetratricopeptide repeat-containing sensor histidine kinase [Flavobacteriaceae bacterium]
MIKALTYLLLSNTFLKRKIFLFWLCASILFIGNAQLSSKDDLLNAIRTFEQGANFSTNDSTYIDLLNKLGSELRFFKTDSLLLLSKKALKLSTSASYKRGQSLSFINLGNYHSDKGNNTKSINFYQKALKIAHEIHNSNLILRIKNNLSSEYGYKGDYAKALNGYLESNELAEKQDNKKMLSIINENIANLYASQKDYAQALVFFKKVKRINEEIGNELYSAETLSNMASVYADMGKLEYAMYNVNSSIHTFEKLQIMDWLAYAYEVKGKTYLKQNKFKWALYWYSQSEMLHNNLEDDRGEIDLLNGIAEAHLGLQKDSLSQQYALKAFEISSKLKFKEGIQKCANTLYKINKNKQNYANALTYHELYQKLSDTLSRNENSKSLIMLKTKLEHDKQKLDLIQENEQALATQRNYVNAALAILLIFIIVTVLVHRSDKIQKRLNKELQSKKEALEKNEEELMAINETKDKLFSIIAHDLRGPIGAFQGLLKLFKDGDIGQKEFLGFIPKLGADLDHISFTLNNLLSWGQSQMNGSVTKPSMISLDCLVSDNINLLSEIAAGKFIKIVSHLPENTIAWSDGDQIDIVIRNLISNALKFTPENGMITISAKERNNHWELSIRDTGVGMNKDTQDKIFSENSNITTYGTNNEKGTGLGLSLCKEMVEKNNGTIWAESVLRKGSSFFFTLPKEKKEYKKAS